MRHEYISDVESRISFAKKAAIHFAENPMHWSFTDGEIASGEILALRWGLDGQSVAIMEIGEAFTPTIYGDAITHAAKESAE